ncbi:MAG: N-succinylarginine dihydrolase [Pseudomonadota bacterium]
MTTQEWHFDGLVGPTHNYSGLSFGNIASAKNQGAVANPRLAALQGLAKMKALHDRGWRQGVLAPHERPNLAALRALGFMGDDATILNAAARNAKELFNSAMSASSMWAANAATVSPSANTEDKRVHFTAANLNNKFHRSMEHPTTSRLLRSMFADEQYFVHHAALQSCPQLGDEGAANHTRFCNAMGERGIEFFVFGAYGFDPAAAAPKRFPARQTYEASSAVARLHRLNPAHTVFAQQHPDVIDAGVFHSDVIAVGHRNVLLCHEHAFANQQGVIRELQAKSDGTIQVVCVREHEVPVRDAVASYLFNSQLLSRSGNSKLTIVVPEECRKTGSVWRYLQALIVSGGPIDELLVFDLRESMMNGGGPACLRLRVELNAAEANAVNSGVVFTDSLYTSLTDWVGKHYRDRMGDDELADPALVGEVRTALDELTHLMSLGAVYPFQI